MEPVIDDGSHDWTEPGVYSVADGVYRIPLPLPNDGLRAINVYALTGGDSLTLIDSGWALDDARRQLATALRALGAELGDVGQFLVTHVHRDHYTLAVSLRREYGGRIALGKLEGSSLEISAQPGLRPMAAQGKLLRRAGAAPVLDELMAAFAGTTPPADDNVWEQPDEWLTPGVRRLDSGRELEVVHTPGHTAGHVVFADAAEGLLFSGDHVLPRITPSIGFEPATTELPLRDFLGSLRLVREMPDHRLLPAHGPVSPSVHARVDELLAHHDARLAEIGETVVAGADTAYQAALRLTWTRRGRALTDLDVFNRMLAILETGAHLDLLALRGQLAVTDTEDGVRHYSVP